MTLTVAEGDQLMAGLINARDQFDFAEGEAFLARLVLVLANEVGDLDVLVRSIAVAVESALPAAASPADLKRSV